MNSLKFHTSQQQSLGFTSLRLDIAYTNGLLDESQIGRACQLAVHTFIWNISKSITRTVSSREVKQPELCYQQGTQGDSLDEILEQVLCEGSHLISV